MFVKVYQIVFFIIIFSTKIILAEAYFDLSENNIKIETDFNGKEIIIFGILNDDQEMLMTIKGPEKNTMIKTRYCNLLFILLYFIHIIDFL